MLERLVEYAEGHDLTTEPGFAPKEIRWAIVCDLDGGFVGIQGLGDTDEKQSRGRRFERCPDLSQPELKRGGAGARHFLVDTAEVVALVGHEDPDEKLLAKHDYFVGLLEQAADAMPVLGTAAACLRDPSHLAEARGRLEAEGAGKNDKVTMIVEGQDPLFSVDSEAWHDWWRSFRANLAPERSPNTSGRVRCLASGELIEPARTHPKVRGLTDVGGHSAGDVFAGFKQSSFRSYGLVQSENAPMSEEMAATYAASLNRLIRDNSQRLAGVRVVHWFKRPVPKEADPLDFLNDPKLEETEEGDAMRRALDLLTAVRDGRRPDLANNEYYALTVSGASGRLMVRDWMEGPFEELAVSIVSWYEDLAIVRRDGKGLAPLPKFLAILRSLVRDFKELPAPLEARLWRAAVKNEPLPFEVLGRALPKIRTEILKNEPLRHARMGLLKAFHLRQGDRGMKSGLNEEYPSAAYQSGRLLAVLAAIQREAVGDVGAGVVQRFYAAASATPSLTVGRMLRGAQHHLHKIQSTKPRLARWFEERLGSVMSRIQPGQLPQTLTLEEQSLFALGYYHQLAHREGKPSETETTEETADD